MNAEAVLKEIGQQTSVCTRCKLHYSRRNAVPGAGNPNSTLMFIGEGPGFHENQQGLPFVGAAGSFLDELLAEAGLKREDVFITNVVKCRPPGNRDPQPEELEACKPYLERQIAAINPDVIVTLGRFSMGHFINNGKISSIHGRSFWSNGRMVIPMYHPAAALHQPSLRSVVVEDFQKLPGMINEAQEARRSNPDQASFSAVETLEDTQDDHGTEQLSLF
ncbi:MAG TPA: uracil-DNA glycosylase [Anaerolineaceae bacterium]|nr:MAG: Uracil-DNA glycosylase [Anaerolineaceae bacterium 46_22]HAF48947.1 uracil-DNA glycosylase [Anaerolineaceae bacterium]